MRKTVTICAAGLLAAVLVGGDADAGPTVSNVFFELQAPNSPSGNSGSSCATNSSGACVVSTLWGVTQNMGIIQTSPNQGSDPKVPYWLGVGLQCTQGDTPGTGWIGPYPPGGDNAIWAFCGALTNSININTDQIVYVVFGEGY
jgi:hypothetical protein